MSYTTLKLYTRLIDTETNLNCGQQVLTLVFEIIY